ncbi:MAG: YccF domain-containing protein [Bacteroidales bacterium]|nr:YccF domain-containing protein [Bacteroidales bacterium]
MNFLGNIVWILLGGLLTSIMYFLGGLILCITIIGIPFGLQIMKLGVLALCPFGKEVTMNPTSGCLTTAFNVLWVVFGWWEIALVHVIFGLILCITIIGIPFGKQHFKLAKYSLVPFGCTIH